MGVVDAVILGVAALALVSGQLVPAIIIALVAVVVGAATEKKTAKPESQPVAEEPMLEVTVQEWEELLPVQETLDTERTVEPEPLSKKARLGPERMRFREPLIGECSVHDCPDCGEGLVSVRVHDGHPVNKCDRC